jgi:hypothetical protein
LLELFIPAGFENFFLDLGLDQNKMTQSGEEDQVLLHVLEKKYSGKFVFE